RSLWRLGVRSEQALWVLTFQVVQPGRWFGEEAQRDRRTRGMQFLSEMGSFAAPVVPFLRLNLLDGDEAVRSDAAVALGQIGQPAESAIPQLAGLLRPGRSERERKSAA